MNHHSILFITGGTSGIAKATVLAAAHVGYTVVFVARRAQEGQAVVQEALDQGAQPGQVQYYQGDVTDFNQLEQIVHRVREEVGSITHLFCCAGTYIPGDLLNSRIKQWYDLRTLNVMHMVMTMKYILPMMIEQGSGSVVLMGSDQTFIAKAQSSIYGATKAAIGQLAKSTALDYASSGIRVNAVCPGTIQTDQALANTQTLADSMFGGDIQAAMHELSKGQMIERRGTADEVAQSILFLLSDKASFITGTLLSVDGGYVST